MKIIKRSGTLVSSACVGALLLACSARQPSLAPHTVPMPAVGADGYYAIGRAEYAARHVDAAQRSWQAALRLDPRHADTRNSLAVLLAERGKYHEAITLWRTLVEEGAALPAAERAFLLGNLGYALYLQGEHDEAVTFLEKACVLDPYQPLGWEHLASVLEALGQTDRALQMMKQARTLRTHDIRHDYALAGAGTPDAVVPATTGPSPWPAGMARTELRQSGAVVEVHRVAAPQPLIKAGRDAGAGSGAASTHANANSDAGAGAGTDEGDAGLRLEISNGNGVRGLAAAWKRRLAGPAWKSVRLTNDKPFAVPVTRIEYRSDPDAGVVARALAFRLGLPAPHMLADGAPVAARTDLRIVLGRDRRGAAEPAGKAGAQGTLQAP